MGMYIEVIVVVVHNKELEIPWLNGVVHDMMNAWMQNIPSALYGRYGLLG